MALCSLMTACGAAGSQSEDAHQGSPSSDADAGGAVSDSSSPVVDVPVVTQDAGANQDVGAEPETHEALDVMLDTEPTIVDTAPGPAEDAVSPAEVHDPAPTEDVAEEPADVSPGLVTLGGGILILELASDFINQAGAGARFIDAVPSADPEAVFGPCVVTTGDPDAPSPPPDFGYDAGEIVVSGTTPTVTLSPVDEGADGTGYVSGLPEDLESVLPVGGALLSITGAGGADIPAFSMHVQVPEPMSLTSPSTGLFQSVSASSDLTVTWNAGTGQTVLVTMSPLSSTFQLIAGAGLVCTASGDPGALVIPAAARGAVKNSGVGTVAIGVTRMRTSEANAGAWVVPVAVTRSTGGPVGLD